MLVRNYLEKDHPYAESRTEKGWKKKNRMIREDAQGELMYCNAHYQTSARYYTFEETREPSAEELAALRHKKREIQKKSEERRQKEIEQRIRTEEAWKWREKLDEMDLKHRKVVKSMLRFLTANVATEQVELLSKTIVIDTETTGLDCRLDEVLQISIIDAEGNELMNTYVKPYFAECWPDAQAVHGIKPEMVENAPYPHEIASKLKSIFDGAELIIGYNLSFDLGFLAEWGMDFEGKQTYDVMINFAEIYGEWNDYYGNYKWQKLSTCARYFDYEFQAHDALEDVRATLHCYKKIIEMDS